MAYQFFEYKNRPLVRSGDMIYYGSMSDDYVVMMQLSGCETLEDLKMAKSVSIKMIDTDESKNLLDRIVKTSEKETLYQALDIADIWLADAEKKKVQG